MSLVITNGYLIDRQDYDTFDEILTFVNEYGNKFVCFAPGVRRINSKNARSLVYGAYLEFEFFHSVNRMSRLKKVTTVTPISFQHSCSVGLDTINQLFYSLKNANAKLVNFYKEILAKVLLDFNEYEISCYSFIKFLKITNFSMMLNCCSKCQSVYDLVSLSFKDKGLICINCMTFEPQFSKEELRFIKDIYNFIDSYPNKPTDKLLTFYELENKDYLINYEQFYKKLSYQWRSYVKSQNFFRKGDKNNEH